MFLDFGFLKGTVFDKWYSVMDRSKWRLEFLHTYTWDELAHLYTIPIWPHPDHKETNNAVKEIFDILCRHVFVPSVLDTCTGTNKNARVDVTTPEKWVKWLMTPTPRVHT